MDNLQQQIVENYRYIIYKLEHGYKLNLQELIYQIIFENYRKQINNADFLETQFVNLESQDDVEYFV